MFNLKKDTFHIPVLTNKIIELLITDKSGIYFDGTIGGGGHSREILNNLNRKGRLVGIDIDSQAVNYSKNQLKIFEDRVIIEKGNYRIK